MFATIGADLSGLLRGLKHADNQVKDSSQMFQSYGEVIDVIERKGTRLGMVLSAAGASALALATDFAMTASRSAELAVVMEVVGSNAGVATDVLHKAAQAIKDEGIESQVAYRTITELTRAEIGLASGIDLATAAGDAATISGENTSQALGGIIHGIRTLNPLVLKRYGYTIDAISAYENEARALGVSAQELTKKQQQIAFTNEILEQAIAIEGAYEAAMGLSSKQIRSMPRYVMQLKEAFGQHLLPVLNVVVGAVNTTIKFFTGLPEPLQAVIAYGTLVGGVFAAITGGLLLLIPQVAKTIDGISAIATVVRAVIAPTQAAAVATEGLAAAQAHATITTGGLNTAATASAARMTALAGAAGTVALVVGGVTTMVGAFYVAMKKLESMWEPFREQLGGAETDFIKLALQLAPGGGGLYDGLKQLEELLGLNKTGQEELAVAMEETEGVLNNEEKTVRETMVAWEEYYDVLKKGATGRTTGRERAPPHYVYGTGNSASSGTQGAGNQNTIINVPPGVASDRTALRELASEVRKIIGESKTLRGTQTAFAGGLA